jgi:serine/threonine-protein kinase RsbW
LLNADSSAAKLACSREFAFSGDPTAMFAARDQIMRFLNAHGVDGDVEIDVLVALQEALANAVVHGCASDPTKTIRCTVEVDDAEINMVIRDPGPGFDSYSGSEFEDGTNLTNHGRGILLMRSLMDEISYHHQGSEVHLKKFRQQPD